MAWKCSACNDIDLVQGIQNDGNCMRCGNTMLEI